MHAFVFTDGALARHAGRFVWLSIDTERAENAGFLERYPLEAWPSLYVIDPATEQVALRWLGSATVPQLVKLLDDGERAVRGSGEGADVALARADKLYGEGRKAEAADAFEEALQQGGPSWPRRPRAIESLIFSLWGARAWSRCVSTALAEGPGLPPSLARANAGVMGLSCALELPKDDPARGTSVTQLEALVREELDRARTGATELKADDVSGLFDLLVTARNDASDAAGAKELARQWAAYLEGEAARATTAEERTVFDSHRMSAYLALEEPARALPMLQEAEQALPEDYNPPARLAVIYRTLKRYDDALAASQRALAKVYGPRKLRVLQTHADILKDLGRTAEARATLEEALRTHDALPKGQQSVRIRQRVQKALEALGTQGAGR